MTTKAKAVTVGKITIVSDAAKGRALIASIEKQGKKLEQDVHVAAVSFMWHAIQHGDITLMNELVVALPALARRNALLEWSAEFGPFKVSEDGKALEHDKHGTADLQAAADKPFWEFKPEAPFRPFSLAAALERLLKEADKKAKDERNGKLSADALDDLKVLRDLQAKHKKAEALAESAAAEAPAVSDDLPQQVAA